MSEPFRWPDGARAAISFSFDDARPSAALLGAPLLAEHGYRGTFFVLMSAVRQEEQAWRAVAAAGHEIANHTTSHPCSGNFSWSRGAALENLTLERISADIDAASADITAFFAKPPTSFAYCCGQKFVGRGAATRSYVPVIAERFRVGRGFRDEYPNDPRFVDLAQVAGVDADRIDLATYIALAEQAVNAGQWLVFAGHDVNDAGGQAVVARELDAFCRWLRARGDVWVAPVDAVGAHLAAERSAAR